MQVMNYITFTSAILNKPDYEFMITEQILQLTYDLYLTLNFDATRAIILD